MKTAVISILFILLSSCASLSDGGSKVKVLGLRWLPKLEKYCKKLGKVDGDRGLKPGFGKRSEQFIQLKNNVGEKSGNIVSMRNVQSGNGVLKGVAFKCKTSFYKARTDESDL